MTLSSIRFGHVPTPQFGQKFGQKFGMSLGGRSREALGARSSADTNAPSVRKAVAVEGYARTLEQEFSHWFVQGNENRAGMIATLDSTLRYLLPDEKKRPTTAKTGNGLFKSTTEVRNPLEPEEGLARTGPFDGTTLFRHEEQALAELLLAQAEAALEQAPARMVQKAASILENLPYPVTPEVDELMAGALSRVLGKAKAGSAETYQFRLAVGIKGPKPETEDQYLAEAREKFMQLFTQAGVNFNA